MLSHPDHEDRIAPQEKNLKILFQRRTLRRKLRRRAAANSGQVSAESFAVFAPSAQQPQGVLSGRSFS